MAVTELKSMGLDLSTTLTFNYDQVKHENAAIFIGSKNSGMNTIVNSIKSIGYQRNFIFRDSLKIYEIQVDEDENISQMIATAYDIYQVFKNLNSAKIILVIDYKENDYNEKSFEMNLTNTLDSLYKHLDYVNSLFKNKIHEFFSSLLVIFNISHEHNFHYNLDILRALAHVYCSKKYQSKGTKILNGYKSKNSMNMVLCKAIGPDHIDSQHIQNVINAIKTADSMRGDILKSITPSLSDTSKARLYKVYEMLLFEDKLSKFQKLLSNFLSKELNKYEIQNVIDPKDYRLFDYFIEMHKIVELDITIHEKILCLQGLHPKIEKAIKQNNLGSITKFMEFTDSVFDLKESEYFLKNLQFIIYDELQKLKELINEEHILNTKHKIIRIQFIKCMLILHKGPEIIQLDAQIKEIQQYNDVIKDKLINLWLNEPIIISKFSDSLNEQINDEIFNIVKKGIEDKQILINTYQVNNSVCQINRILNSNERNRELFDYETVILISFTLIIVFGIYFLSILKNSSLIDIFSRF